jgi:hypothetical protein
MTADIKGERKMKVLGFILLLCGMVFIFGCETVTDEKVAVPEPCEPNIIQEPLVVNNTICIVITSEPNCVDVYGVDIQEETSNMKLSRGGKIGETPLEIPLKFWEDEGDVWLEGLAGGYERSWSLSIEGVKHSLHYYMEKEGYYPVFVNTYVSIIDSNDNNFTTEEALETFRYGYTRTVYNCPVELIENNSAFAERFISAIEEGDYNYAEELRLERIKILKAWIEENNRYLNNWPLEYGKTNGEASKVLISSELELLEHTVGLRDKKLMKFRKRIVKSLNEGRYRTAFMRAKVVEFLEEEYFPKDKPVVVQLPYSKSAQQKPDYGSKQVIQTLYTLIINNASPEEYKSSLGEAKLLDVMGLNENFGK